MIRRFPSIVLFHRSFPASPEKLGTAIGTAIPLLGILFCGFFSILFAHQAFSSLSPDRYAVLHYPQHGSAYYEAAARIDPDFLSPASRFLVQLALDREPSIHNVLGATTETPLTILSKQRQKDASLFDQWMAVVSKYPDYPEAKLRAAYYGIKLGKPAGTITKLLDAASAMMPSGHAVRALRARIVK